MQSHLTVAQAAAEIGVSRELLLSWERRHRIPAPERMPDGSRRYPAALVDALAVVPARRRAGVPLATALAEAAATWSPRPTRDITIPELVYQQALDQLEVAVTVLVGPHYVVEFANSAHQRMYPGVDILGRPALEAFAHSRYYDLAYVLNSVRTTGEALTWHDTLVPHNGVDHWWDFSYSRLPISVDGPVRILMTARDVTDEVQSRRHLDSELQEALRTIQRLRRDGSAFDLLERVSDLVADGANETDPDLLRLLLRELSATSVSTWVCREGVWHSAVSVGGDHWLLPGHGLDKLPLSMHDLIREAVRTGRTIARNAAEINPDASHRSDDILAMPIPRATTARNVVLIARPQPSDLAAATRLLQAVANVVRLTQHRAH